jgi:hypothetical protein
MLTQTINFKNKKEEQKMKTQIGKRRSMYKRNLLVCGIILVGFLTAPLAWADKGHPASVEVSPQEPFQVKISDFTAKSKIELEFATVPQGKRLVMQYVSLQATTLNDSNEILVACRIETGPGGITDPKLDLVVTSKRQFEFTGLDSHLAGGPITLYGEPGDVVVASCNALSQQQYKLQTLSGTLVGYLVKVKKPKQPKIHDDD